jgi:hypothetical protein
MCKPRSPDAGGSTKPDTESTLALVYYLHFFYYFLAANVSDFSRSARVTEKKLNFATRTQ